MRGTIHDPLWQHPDLPEYMRDASSEYKDGILQISSIGFPGPNNTRQYSPALQHQISILTADKEADYYLFDEEDQPVRVVLKDPITRLQFRNVRMSAWCDDSEKGVHLMAALAQYLIKYWGRRPGLSRERILKQFKEEYGDGAITKIEDFESHSAARGYGEETFLEVVSNSIKLPDSARKLVM